MGLFLLFVVQLTSFLWKRGFRTFDGFKLTKNSRLKGLSLLLRLSWPIFAESSLALWQPCLRHNAWWWFCYWPGCLTFSKSCWHYHRLIFVNFFRYLKIFGFFELFLFFLTRLFFLSICFDLSSSVQWTMNWKMTAFLFKYYFFLFLARWEFRNTILINKFEIF